MGVAMGGTRWRSTGSGRSSLKESEATLKLRALLSGGRPGPCAAAVVGSWTTPKGRAYATEGFPVVRRSRSSVDSSPPADVNDMFEPRTVFDSLRQERKNVTLRKLGIEGT